MTDSNLRQKAEYLTNFILERLNDKLNQVEKFSENQFQTLDSLKQECTKMQENIKPLQETIVHHKKPDPAKPSINISESLHDYIQINT